MNYLIGLILVVIFVMMSTKGATSSLNSIPVMPLRPLPKSNSQLPRVPESLGNMGFVKPEHKLKQIFTMLSSGEKVSLTGTCEEYIYNKQMIPAWLNENVVKLVALLVSSLTNLLSQDYFMKGIENVYILQDSKKNARYIIDFFVYDVGNYYTIRLLSDIVVIDGIVYVNYMNVQEASLPILMNRYDVRFETGGILLDKNMFTDTIRTLFDDYYKQSFKINGVSDSQLEYNKEALNDVVNLTSLSEGYIPSHISKDTLTELQVKGLDGYLDMYLPENQDTMKDPSFCKKYARNWDSFGIPEQLSYDDSCVFHTSGSKDMINQPYQGPGSNIRHGSTQYPWLYDTPDIITSL